MRVAETEVQLVVVVDVPVQTGHHLVVRGADGVALVAARIVAVSLVEVAEHLIHELLGRTDDVLVRLEVRIHASGGGADDLAGARHNVGAVLGVHEEEEFVLDDRATHGETDSVIQEIGLVQILTLHLVAADGLGGVVIVNGSVELVGTTLGHGVDGTTGEAGVTDIERRDIDAHLLDGIKGNRSAAGRQVGTDTKGVVERGTVNGHVGGTVVTATDSKTVGGGRCLRGKLHHIVHATADSREVADRTLADRGAGAGAMDVHVGQITVGHEHGSVEVDRIFFKDRIHHEGLAQGGIEILVLIRTVAQHGNGNGVRTARGDVVDTVVTVLVGQRIVGRRRRLIDRDDRGTGDSTVLIGHMAAERRGRHLRSGRHDKKHRCDRQQYTLECLFHNVSNMVKLNHLYANFRERGPPAPQR